MKNYEQLESPILISARNSTVFFLRAHLLSNNMNPLIFFLSSKFLLNEDKA